MPQANQIITITFQRTWPKPYKRRRKKSESNTTMSCTTCMTWMVTESKVQNPPLGSESSKGGSGMHGGTASVIRNINRGRNGGGRERRRKSNSSVYQILVTSFESNGNNLELKFRNQNQSLLSQDNCWSLWLNLILKRLLLFIMKL